MRRLTMNEVTRALLSAVLVVSLCPLFAGAMDEDAGVAPEQQHLEAPEETSTSDHTLLGMPVKDFPLPLPVELAEAKIAHQGQWGACGWAIDADGLLTVWPVEGTDGKLLDSRKAAEPEDADAQRYFPWYEFRAEIKAARFLTGVKAPKDVTGLFLDCVELTSLDVTGLDVTLVEVTDQAFDGCEKLESVAVNDTYDKDKLYPTELVDKEQAVVQEELPEDGDASEQQEDEVAEPSEEPNVPEADVSENGTDAANANSSEPDQPTEPQDQNAPAIQPNDGARTFEGLEITLVRRVYALSETPACPILSAYFYDEETHQDEMLKEGVDYTVSYSDNESIGTAKVTLTGIGDFEGSVTSESYRIVDRIDINDEEIPITLTTDDVFIYHYKPITPKVSGYLGSPRFVPNVSFLREGTDFTVTYQDNDSWGTGKAVVTGHGRLTGTRIVEFDIVPSSSINLKNDFEIQIWDPVCYQDRWYDGNDFYYTDQGKPDEYDMPVPVFFANEDGSPVHPDISVVSYWLNPTEDNPFGSYMRLVEGEDYKVSYLEDYEDVNRIVIDGHSYYLELVRAEGLNGIEGETWYWPYLLADQIDVEKLELDKNSLEQREYLYTGAAVKPKLAYRQDFVEGRDYTLSYRNNTRVGTCTVTVQGKGRYFGSVSIDVPIVSSYTSKRFSDCVVEVSDMTYTGHPVEPEVRVIDPTTGKVLNHRSYNERYRVAYENNVEVGTATVHIIGGYPFDQLNEDVYTGTTSATFQILPSTEPVVQEHGLCGGCTWEVDENGQLRIYPTNGVSGTLYGEFPFPWFDVREKVKSVVFDTGVKAGSMRMMFADMPNLETVDFSGLDTFGTTDMNSLFYKCYALKEANIYVLDTSNVTDMSLLFAYCTSIQTVDFAGMDLSSVQNFTGLFYGCSSLQTASPAGQGTPSATMMGGMFADCSSLVTVDIAGLDTSNVTDMSQMFDGCSNLPSLDLTCFDTSNVTTMYAMMRGCTSLRRLRSVGLNTSRVQNISFMFKDCVSLEAINLSTFSFDSATDMAAMFSGCSSLISIDLSGRAAPNLTRTGALFAGCTSLRSANLSGFATSKVDDAQFMFFNCIKLASIDLRDFDGRKLTQTEDMFLGCSALESFAINQTWPTSLAGTVPAATSSDGKWYSVADGVSYLPSEIASSRGGIADTYLSNAAGKTANIKASGKTGTVVWEIDANGHMVVRPSNGAIGFMLDANPWIIYVDDIKSVTFRRTVIAPESMRLMFAHCANLKEVDFTGLSTFGVTDMSGMFMGCSSLERIDLSGLYTGDVTTMSSMFDMCSELKSAYLGGLDVSKLENAEGMFMDCPALRSVNFSGWDAPRLSRVFGMFGNCKELHTLDISAFDYAKFDSLGIMGMLSDCDNLEVLTVGSKWPSKFIPFAPSPNRNEHWWSTKASAWFLPYEISNNRKGIADTYTSTKVEFPFVDVGATTPHSMDILWLADTGVTTGWTEPNGTRTFRGMNPVVRQDMAAFLYRLAGSPAYEPTPTIKRMFTDVHDGTPHAKEIWWLASTGITTGWVEADGTRTFRGMDSVKRQDMAAFLRRLAAYMGADTSLRPGARNPFSDVNVTTSHYEDILWLAGSHISEGWTEANGTKTFRGMNDVVRQDMAAFLQRLDAMV